MNVNFDSSMTFNLPPELVKTYIVRRFSDVEVCWSALKEHDFSKVENLAHQMKGNGTNFGFPVISQIGADLESAARKNDTLVISNQLDKLHEFLKSIQN